MKRNARIGLLGGTFNPIHTGHLLIARDALEQLKLDRVKFIPSATPPHKPLADDVSAAHRLRMVRLSIRGCEGFEADDSEVRRGGTSYSVETVAALRQRHPDAEFFFIIGSDSLPELPRWREIERLARMCVFAVVARPGFELEVPAGYGVRCRVVQGHLFDVASREIRERVAAKQSVRWLVPEPVLRYIQRTKLYQRKGHNHRSS